MAETWGQRPSEMLGLDEDPYTTYCFDQAIAYMILLAKMPNGDDMGQAPRPQGTQGTQKKEDDALDFLMDPRFKA